MRCWTIQTANVWQSLQKNRVWRADLTFVEESWVDAYEWLIRQMRNRVGYDCLDGQVPVWVWYQWNGAKNAMPDLRSRAHLPSGTKGVRLELEVDENRILLSDFVLWHFVLNKMYIPTSSMDEIDFEEKLESTGGCRRNSIPVNPDLAAKLYTSWEQIFDIEKTNKYVTDERLEKSIQGVMWELRLDDVRSVKEFTAR